MALVPIFRPAPFGLAQRWRPSEAVDAKAPAKPRTPQPEAPPSPHPARPEPDDERPLTTEEHEALRERLATAIGAVSLCRRAACRRAGRCRGKSVCLRAHRKALQPALNDMHARLRAKLAGETFVSEPEPEPARTRQRPGGRRRKARRAASQNLTTVATP